MTLTVEAVYQNGQLKLKESVVLAEGTPVRVTITPIGAAEDPLAGFIRICETGRTDGAKNHDKYLARAPRQLGTLKGTILYMAPDFDAPLEDATKEEKD